MNLGYLTDKHGRRPRLPVREGVWNLDEDDLLVIAMLQDPIYGTELLWDDPTNHEYGGCFRWRDYQYDLCRPTSTYQGHACARSVGKTESIKAKSFVHPFRRHGQNLLLTAPELIHLLPLTDAVEDRIRNCRLTRDFLDTRGGKTGFTHRPFGVDFVDGSNIVGRIPRLTGTGVKGQHQPDLIVDEAQDYPERGWIEVHEPLALSTPVPTPIGWRTIGQLEPGDEVFARDGKPTTVLGLSAIRERPTYAVTFDDGETVVTDAGHRWTVTCNRYLWKGKWTVRTTGEIAEDLTRPGRAFGSPGQPWLLPDAAPVRYPARELPLDPYTLGALLGDGTMRHGNLALSVPAHKQSVQRECVLVGGDEWSQRQTSGCPSAGVRGGATIAVLRELGLYGSLSTEKFIPDSYLTASVEQRLELLRGLMDTDGNVHRSGALRYSTASPLLLSGVRELVRSLGGRLSEHQLADGSWQLFVRLPRALRCASRPDMLAAMRDSRLDKLRRRIVSVAPTGYVEPVRCLMVADDEHLFLVGRSYIPTHNTVMKDTVDVAGNPDFHYEFYGVHSGARDSGFFKRVGQGAFALVQITAMQRPGWGKAEKEAAKAAYGGTGSPDYRRNILGEPGAAASAFFVISRLIACVDQDRESKYNQHDYVFQELRAEEVDELELPMAEVLDLPTGVKNVWGGMDVGLTNSPTAIVLFTQGMEGKGRDRRERLKLFRRIELNRFRSGAIVDVWLAIGFAYRDQLLGFGVDSTGLGFPIVQAMEDHQGAPEHLLEITRGYFFNSKVPVGVDESFVTTDASGRLRDQYGAAVQLETDPLTGISRYVTYMPMIEASTRYLRDDVDTGFMLLPFDTAITTDMMGETQQRVRKVGELRKKPNAFHILDAMRAMAMVRKAGDIEEALALPPQTAVLDAAL